MQNILKYSSIDKEIMARTIYGESRGEYYQQQGGLSALISIGNVIVNRIRHKKKWYGNNVQEVCKKPYQFSCWNCKDPNYAIINSIKQGDDKIFDVCLEVAENILNGNWPDLTKGSVNYHSKRMNHLPQWAIGRKPKIEICNHVFYEL